jgi:competence protein ComGC
MSFSLVQAIPLMAVFIVICILPLLIIMSVANSKSRKRVQELEAELKILRGHFEK